MSAQDELPPRWKWQVGPGITREELATMRAAVERCAELERLVDDAEHGRATALTVRDAQAERCSKAEAALAKVTAERDGARDEAETWRRYAHIEDRGYLREVGAAAEFAWERATPTEGECSECGATSEERGLLPCDMPGCPRATPTEGE